MANGQWRDQDRMRRVAGPPFLLAVGVILLLAYALVLIAAPGLPALASGLILLAAGIAFLAGLAWAIGERRAAVEE